MVRRRPSPSELLHLRAVAAYQWDWRVAANLVRDGEEYIVDFRRGRPRHVILEGRVYLTLRPGDGLFSLTLSSAERVREASEPPRYRVIVRRGEFQGSVLAPIVASIDPRLRPGDEVLVVDEDDKLLGVGRLRVPPRALEALSRGEIVRVRRVRENSEDDS